jgi:methanogenic corrinoid protein MtbC1
MGLGQRALRPDCWVGVDEGVEPRRRALHDAMSGPVSAQAGFATLARALDDEVIPRLVLARRAALPCAPLEEQAARAPIGSQDVLDFARLVLDVDPGAAADHVAAVLARGASLESVFLDLLGPTARCLGDMWNEDLCDFTQVTVGLWRLQQIVRDLSPAFAELSEPRDQARRALLVPVPGEQHTFGLFMVAEFFRRAGWDVWAGPVASGTELLDLVRHDWYAVVGISVSSDVRLEGLAATIHAVRRASRNRGVGVMVGGPPFLDRPELAALVGADASAVDGRQATHQAEGLLALAARRA